MAGLRRCRWGGKVKSLTPKVPKADGKKKPTGRAKKRKQFNKRILGNNQTANTKMEQFYKVYDPLDRHRKSQEAILMPSVQVVDKSDKENFSDSVSTLIWTRQMPILTKRMTANGQLQNYRYRIASPVRKYATQEKSIKADRKWKIRNQMQFETTGTCSSV